MGEGYRFRYCLIVVNSIVLLFISMTKAEEKKLIKSLKDTIPEFKESDLIIVKQIIDYLKIDEVAKNQLFEETENGAMQWTTVSTIAIVTKNITALIQSLGVSPKDRIKLKALLNNNDSNDNGLNNLKSFLNEQ